MNDAHTACAPYPAGQTAAAALVLRLLGELDNGSLDIALPSGETCHLGHGTPAARLEAHDWKLFDAVLARGDIGFGESYVAGLWDTDDLPRLLTLLATNRRALDRAIYGNAWRLITYRLAHLFRANTRRGSRRNIHAHYDLGNEFYALWLDPTMTYSSALFAGDASLSLEDAQRAKYRRILDRLELHPGQRILEIGCGWGGLAEVAASEYDVCVHGLTLSPAQLEYASERAHRRGFAHSTTFELRDYRDARGVYDHVVSIEMYEAVGERYWPVYFRLLRDLVKPGGKILVQAITIADALFARYRRGADFIQRYVFPGGMLASPGVFAANAERAGLAVRDAFAFGPDYAHTLRRWHERFAARADRLRHLGFDSAFERLWRFYLAYCEAGFASGATDVYHFELVPERH